jgi:hypothetical protein
MQVISFFCRSNNTNLIMVYHGMMTMVIQQRAEIFYDDNKRVATPGFMSVGGLMTPFIYVFDCLCMHVCLCFVAFYLLLCAFS